MQRRAKGDAIVGQLVQMLVVMGKISVWNATRRVPADAAAPQAAAGPSAPPPAAAAPAAAGKRSRAHAFGE